MNNSTRRFFVPGQLISDVGVQVPSDGQKPTRVFLLLHGFTQDGSYIAKRLESAVVGWQKATGGSALVLAPNATYPQPERTESGWKVGFSWYFYDPVTDEFFIDMQNSIVLLQGIITQAEESLQVSRLPVTVVGFSQGGYLAPFFAKTCPQVDHVIGIGCEFLKDELQDPLPFRLDGIHGADDAIVDPQNAKKSHTELVARGAQGSFQILDQEGHKISRVISQHVLDLLMGVPK